MEKELVLENLTTISNALKSDSELLIEQENQDLLKICSKEDFEDPSHHRDKDRAKFVISKTIAYSPSAFAENAEILESFLAFSEKLIHYLKDRQMTPVAELVEELINNERKKDSSHFDYHYKSGS